MSGFPFQISPTSHSSQNLVLSPIFHRVSLSGGDLRVFNFSVKISGLDRQAVHIHSLFDSYAKRLKSQITHVSVILVLPRFGTIELLTIVEHRREQYLSLRVSVSQPLASQTVKAT